MTATWAPENLSAEEQTEQALSIGDGFYLLIEGTNKLLIQEAALGAVWQNDSALGATWSAENLS